MLRQSLEIAGGNNQVEDLNMNLRQLNTLLHKK